LKTQVNTKKLSLCEEERRPRPVQAILEARKERRKRSNILFEAGSPKIYIIECICLELLMI